MSDTVHDWATDYDIFDPAYVAENLLTVAPADLTHAVDADLGGKVVYLGNKVDRTRLVPGDKVQVRHYWKVVSAPGPQWRVFSHLRGDTGKPDFSNVDETDMRWGHPPSAWRDGEIIQDVQDFALSPEWKSSKATLIVGLFLFFERTLRGKALRATAVNRLGARLMGISTSGAGKLSFGLAAFIGALSGLLIGPTTTIFYDSGFLIGLKGFVGAIFGALASYPAAALGALFVGLIEAFGSFWASAFKEVIVFTLILPVLLWRSFQAGHHDEEE